MIVQRVTTKVKIDCMDKAVELLKAEIASWDKPPKWRIYTPNIGKKDTASIELEFENLAEFEKFWTAWWAKPTTAEFWNKRNELVETGEITEIWDLVE